MERLSIEKFDLSKINRRTLLLIGKRKSGACCLLKDILFHLRKQEHEQEQLRKKQHEQEQQLIFQPIHKNAIHDSSLLLFDRASHQRSHYSHSNYPHSNYPHSNYQSKQEQTLQKYSHQSKQYNNFKRTKQYFRY